MPAVESARHPATCLVTAWAWPLWRAVQGSAAGPYAQIAEVSPRTTTTYTDAPGAGTFHYRVRAYYGTKNGSCSCIHSRSMPHLRRRHEWF